MGWEQVGAPVDQVELDPETRAIVDEVCTALEWFAPGLPGSHEPAQAMRFGRKWWVAYRHSADPVCRQKIVACCEAIVRADPNVLITVDAEGRAGALVTRETLGRHRGRVVYLPDPATGDMRSVIQWPTGTYANGEPSYERKEAA